MAETKFSLAHLTVLGCAPPEMTYIAARAGYDFVSFRPIFMGLPNEPNYALADNPDLLRRTKAALVETGVKLHDIELARIHDGMDARAKYLPAFETAAELGARRVISSVWTPNREFAIERYAELCDLARPLGLTVDLEFVTFAEVRDLAEALQVVRAAGKDNCGIMVDTLHFARSRVSLAELDAVPREWLHFAHICDGPAEIPDTREGLIHTARDERLYLGEGGIDVASILGRMPEMVYSVELPHLERVKEFGYAEHACRCLETARRYLAAHPREDPGRGGAAGRRVQSAAIA